MTPSDYTWRLFRPSLPLLPPIGRVGTQGKSRPLPLLPGSNGGGQRAWGELARRPMREKRVGGGGKGGEVGKGCGCWCGGTGCWCFDWQYSLYITILVFFCFCFCFVYRGGSATMRWSSTHVLFGSLGHLWPRGGGVYPMSIFVGAADRVRT